MPEIKQFPVDWKYEGRKSKITTGVFHWVSAKNVPEFQQDPYNIKAILKMFKEGVEWAGKIHHFSAHWLYDRDGGIYSLVNIKDTAWHAGQSVGAFPEYKIGYNSSTIGHELFGMKDDPFTENQYRALAWRCWQDEIELLEKKLGKIINYVGHDWISGEIAVRLNIKSKRVKKIDPGPLFDYQKFYHYLVEERLKEKVEIKSLSDFKTGTLWREIFKRFRGGK